MPNETPYLSVSDAVQRLEGWGVTVTSQTVRRWAKSGKIRSKRLATGRQILVSADDLAGLLEPIEVVA